MSFIALAAPRLFVKSHLEERHLVDSDKENTDGVIALFCFCFNF